MATQIYLNLAVSDLGKSMAFFKSLGFEFNLKFTNDEAACLVVSDVIFAMLHTPASFRRFTPLPICDAHQSTEVMIALSRETRAEVDEMVRRAVAAGGTTFREAEDYGFMYGHAFKDLDGHIWEVLHLVEGEADQPAS